MSELSGLSHRCELPKTLASSIFFLRVGAIDRSGWGEVRLAASQQLGWGQPKLEGLCLAQTGGRTLAPLNGVLCWGGGVLPRIGTEPEERFIGVAGGWRWLLSAKLKL